ncbi:unnamed protein product, partial [Nesidiocoris tenuis]
MEDVFFPVLGRNSADKPKEQDPPASTNDHAESQVTLEPPEDAMPSSDTSDGAHPWESCSSGMSGEDAGCLDQGIGFRGTIELTSSDNEEETGGHGAAHAETQRYPMRD